MPRSCVVGGNQPLVGYPKANSSSTQQERVIQKTPRWRKIQGTWLMELCWAQHESNGWICPLVASPLTARAAGVQHLYSGVFPSGQKGCFPASLGRLYFTSQKNCSVWPAFLESLCAQRCPCWGLDCPAGGLQHSHEQAQCDLASLVWLPELSGGLMLHICANYRTRWMRSPIELQFWCNHPPHPPREGLCPGAGEETLPVCQTTDAGWTM